MSDPNKLVGRLVKIADKMGVVASCEYLEETTCGLCLLCYMMVRDLYRSHR